LRRLPSFNEADVTSPSKGYFLFMVMFEDAEVGV
jgi:hypothetical protein